MFETVISDLELMVCESGDKQQLDCLQCFRIFIPLPDESTFAVTVFYLSFYLHSVPPVSSFLRDYFTSGVYNFGAIVLFFREFGNELRLLFSVFYATDKRLPAFCFLYGIYMML